MKDLVSVIVPIYMVENDLIDCIESIINQTYNNLEIFLVNDGSPDNCRNIAEKYAKRDERIILINKVNGGLSDARNVALERIHGKYVTFVDSDDILNVNFIEKMISLIIEKNAQVAVCAKKCFVKSDNDFKENNVEENYVTKVFSAYEGVSNMLYQKDFDVAAWGKVYLSSFFDDIRFPKGLIHEDIPVIYKALIKSERIVYTNEQLYYYQIRKNSIENEKFSIKKMDCIINAESMFKDIKENYIELIKPARSRYIAAHFHILFQIKKNIPEKKKIINNIKKQRKYVIIDKNALIRTRLACLLSYFGFDFTMKIFNFMKKEKGNKDEK